MKILTPPQRAALEHMLHTPLPADQLHPATIRALTSHKLCQHSDDGYTITPAGREALKQHIPRLLHRRIEKGYTSNPALAASDEPESIDPAQLHPMWTNDAQERHHSAQPNHIRAQALRRAA